MDDRNSVGSEEVGQQQKQEQRQQQPELAKEERSETEEEEGTKEGDELLDQQDTALGIGFDDREQMSPYERRLRKEYARAMKKLQRRILEESGNAAASGRYTDHLTFRRWQMGVEEEVFQEMLAAL